DYSSVLLFVVGGITAAELREVREVAKERGIKLTVGSTAVVEGDRIMKSFFPPIPEP
ncbi:hypothetical protein HK405_014945, partial [Cladochytrium tenue]